MLNTGDDYLLYNPNVELQDSLMTQCVVIIIVGLLVVGTFLLLKFESNRLK